MTFTAGQAAARRDDRPAGDPTHDADRASEADELSLLQRRKLVSLLDELRASNPFYRSRLVGVDFQSPDLLKALPFTTRADIEADQQAWPPYGTNLTYPLQRYTRYCQTSGTGGRPVRWLDTPESWAWVGECWKTIFEAAGVTRQDRLLFAFSFGPFLGFWGAFDSSVAHGFLSIPAGGLSTSGRLRMLLDNQATIVLCTPTYALHMAETARREGIDLAGSPVRALFVAGEPGGSIPETRRAIETAWGARVFDHSGMTELGPMSFECREAPGSLHVIETEFIVESVDPRTGSPVADGEIGELVVTNLGRRGSPLIRYRTGDQARIVRGRCKCGRCLARLQGGILGRVDDMFIVRGNNVFPTAVEAVLRRFPEIAEYRVHVLEDGALTQVRLEIEPVAGAVESDLCERVGRTLQESLSFRAEVRSVASGSLPRFEMKARRIVRIPNANPGARA